MLLRFVASFAIVSAVSVLNPELVRADVQVPYPAAASGQYQASVPYLAAAGEGGLVEVTIGKTMHTDGCNSFTIAGDSLSKKTLEGWGASYYVFQKGDPERVLSTRMNCPGDGRDQFVAAAFLPEAGADGLAPGAGKFFIRNRQGGTAFYLPEDYDLHYRVWVPGADDFSALRQLAAQTVPAEQAAQESDLQAAPDKPSADLGRPSGGEIAGHNPNFGRSPAM